MEVRGGGAMYIIINHYYDADLCVHHDGEGAQSAISCVFLSVAICS